MRTKHAFMASLVVAFVLLSALVYHRAPQHSATGTVVEFEADQWIAVATDSTRPKGFQFALRKATSYEWNRSALKPGIRVTVWYRGVGERRFVADKVRLLPVAATR